MRAGELRDRVQIQADVSRVDLDADAYGDVPERWETVAERWADVTQQEGRENWQADQSRPDVTVEVRIRYFAGLSPRHRLLFGSVVLNVGSVIDPDGRKREMVLACRQEA